MEAHAGGTRPLASQQHLSADTPRLVSTRTWNTGDLTTLRGYTQPDLDVLQAGFVCRFVTRAWPGAESEGEAAQ